MSRDWRVATGLSNWTAGQPPTACGRAAHHPRDAGILLLVYNLQRTPPPPHPLATTAKQQAGKTQWQLKVLLTAEPLIHLLAVVDGTGDDDDQNQQSYDVYYGDIPPDVPLSARSHAADVTTCKWSQMPV
ncbi:hypothetical protein AK812_SmicGene36279 [Symbiodinium microadriaticum]|uniref:Uncharacterized protein n=1 Tax=Symbiodinium microadriaticum TaxID=2951 RepID=A0A1Q9CJG2_SYMMI|nr:hypothetical protein AK812_SmicGene36279 [Symbiodinium microadriaticum]